ncbi:MAG: c-type cytochrome [Pseudomonadota bacterium]
MNGKVIIVCNLLIAVLACAIVSDLHAGDSAYGEYLANECVTCHRVDGTQTNIPDITGWPEEAFVAVLVSYKTKERENRVMQTIAAGLGDAEMAALAAYFAKVKPKVK